MATKKKPAEKVNKTQFVLGESPTASAAYVVARGKDQGIELTEAYVYSVRSKARGKNGAGKPKRRAAASNGSSVRREAFEGMEPTAARVLTEAHEFTQDMFDAICQRIGRAELRRRLADQS